MSGRIFFVFLIIVLLGACAAPQEAKMYGATPLDDADEEACRDLPGKGPPVDRPIVISYKDGSVQNVEPYRSCARPGDLLKFVLTGPPETLVKVRGKTTDDEWIRGGGNQRFFYVLVPHDIIEKGDRVGRLFRYEVIVAGNGEDPEVRVRHQ